MPGHIQPRTWLVDPTLGHVQPCPATVLTCLLSSRPQVRVLLGAPSSLPRSDRISGVWQLTFTRLVSGFVPDRFRLAWLPDGLLLRCSCSRASLLRESAISCWRASLPTGFRAEVSVARHSSWRHGDIALSAGFVLLATGAGACRAREHARRYLVRGRPRRLGRGWGSGRV